MDPGDLTRGLVIMGIKRVINGEPEVIIPQEMATEEVEEGTYVISTPRENSAQTKAKAKSKATNGPRTPTATTAATSSSSRG